MQMLRRVRVIKTGSYKDPSNLEYEETTIKEELEEDEVLVSVEACGVCFRDIIDREGGNPFLNIPISLGHEISGHIIKSNASEWKVGDRIVSLHGVQCGSCNYCSCGDDPRCLQRPDYLYGLTHNGGYQTILPMHGKSIVKFPAKISYSEACFLNCTAAVALRGLKHHGKINSDKVVLITGASGGVGVHAIQVAKAYGAFVIAITSNPTKEGFLLELGADKVIISKENSFHQEVIEQVGKVDIVLELVGEPTILSGLRCLNPTGVLVVIGNISVKRANIALGSLILYENKIVGSSGASKKELMEVFELVEQNKLRPIVHSELPLSIEGVQAAHRLLKEKSVMGRVVLRSRL